MEKTIIVTILNKILNLLIKSPEKFAKDVYGDW